MRNCRNCGARLPAQQPGVLRCPFCGAEEERQVPVSGFGGGGTPMYFVPPQRSSPIVPVVIALSVAVMMGGGVLASALVSTRSRPPPPEVDYTPVIPPPLVDPLPKPPKITLQNLATTPFQGWEAIDAPGYVGTFDAFDPVANFGWAKSIGEAWKPDALVQRIDVDHVAKDGLIDLVATPESSLEYRLFSPKCIKDYQDSTAVVDPKMNCELDIRLKKEDGRVQIKVVKTGDQLFAVKDDREIKSPVCTLTQAFGKLDKAAKLPNKPLFNAYLYDVSFQSTKLKPRWNFSQIITGMDTVGYVNADTCAVE